MDKQLGIFDKPAAPPQLIELTGMEWEQAKNGDWIAQGRRGRFCLWEEGRKWRGRYLSRADIFWFDLPRGLSLEQLKKMCENNCYWER